MKNSPPLIATIPFGHSGIAAAEVTGALDACGATEVDALVIPPGGSFPDAPLFIATKPTPASASTTTPPIAASSGVLLFAGDGAATTGAVAACAGGPGGSILVAPARSEPSTVSDVSSVSLAGMREELSDERRWPMTTERSAFQNSPAVWYRSFGLTATAFLK